MANLHGFGSDAVGNLVNHYTRHNGDPDQTKYRYANQNIDKERTKYNYALYERPDPAGYVREQIARATVKPKAGGKKETNVLSDWVVTLPQNQKLKGREREFFEQAYAFLCERVPEEMRLGAWVHMDENQPHMHFAFCPILKTPAMTNDKSKPLVWKKKDEKKNPAHKAGTPKLDTKGTPRYERVQRRDEHGNLIWNISFGQSKVFTREKMKAFHPDLERAMEEHFGFVVGIQLEDPGEKQLSKLEQKDYIAAKRTLEKQSEQIEENTKRLELVRQREAEEAAAVAELERAIEQAEMEPAPEGIGESARALWTARGDGEREEVIGSEIEGLRGRISELEGECAELGEQAADLERGMPRLRERVRELGARLDHARMAVRDAIAKLAEVPRGLSDAAREMARALGKRIAGERLDPARMAAEASRVASGVSLRSESATMRDASRKLERGSHVRGAGRGER